MSKIEESATPPMPWVDGNSQVFGVIAHPVTHVRAPMVFNPRFAAAGLGHIMVPIDAPPAALDGIIRGLQTVPNFGGLAVTIPHKLTMAELCDELGTVARLTGAVNAVRLVQMAGSMVIILMGPGLSLVAVAMALRSMEKIF